MTAMQDDNPFRADADPWPTLDAAVQEAGVVADRARAFYGDRLKSVWLYGSRARQDNRPDSDLDVLLVRESPPGLDPTEDTTDLYDPTFRDLIEQERDYYSVLIWPIQIKSARPEQWETWDTMFFRAAREDAIRIL